LSARLGGAKTGRNYFRRRGFLVITTFELPFKGERMKKLFTIACTLVLGSALSFAQAASTSQTTPAGDQTKTSTSTTTKKHHKHGTKKSGKKSKKSTEATPAPAASPSPK
jgi:hypothetical protein